MMPVEDPVPRSSQEARLIITGTTSIIGIVGTPIVQVHSPSLMNAHFEARRSDVAIVPIDLRREAVEPFVATIRAWQNLCGMVVTVPYKQLLAPLCDDLTPRAKRLGTVNVIRRDPDGSLHGEILDGAGFVTAAVANGFEARGCRAAIIGAGGVASAIADAVCEAGIGSLVLTDLDPVKAHTLRDRLQQAFPSVVLKVGINTLTGVDLLVNATAVGMNGDPSLPLPAPLLHEVSPACFVADVVTAPVMTPLLTLAQARGCRVQTGPEMTEAQMLALLAWLHVPG